MEMRDQHLLPLEVTYHDDPRVVKEAATEDYTTHVVPRKWRIGRLSLSMSWYSVVSGMFYLVTAATLAAVVGTVNTIIGILLACAVFGVIAYVLSAYAAKTGLTVALMSQRIFGAAGSAIAPFILAATAIYYGVFESSVIAHAFHAFFGVLDIRIWYAIAVAMNLPLVMGGIRRWMDKYNAVLLPVYWGGLIVTMVVATMNYDMSGWMSSGPDSTADLSAPGWLYAFFVYLGVLVLIMYTIDFARFGKPKDTHFNGIFTFGPVFYLFVYLANGLIGIFLAYAAGISGDVSSASVVNFIIALLGGWGLVLVWVTQARINTANYYVASTNIEALWARLFHRHLPRVYAVVICGVISYLFMLTNVLDYLLVALAWQGAFIASWVGIVLVHVVMQNRAKNFGTAEFRAGRIYRYSSATWIWTITSVLAVLAYQFGGVIGQTWSTPAALVVGGGTYALAYARQTRKVIIQRDNDPRHEVDDVWEARVKCHSCDRSYIAVEIDRDPSQPGMPAICAGCGVLSRRYHQASIEVAVSPKTAKENL